MQNCLSSLLTIPIQKIYHSHHNRRRVVRIDNMARLADKIQVRIQWPTTTHECSGMSTADSIQQSSRASLRFTQSRSSIEVIDAHSALKCHEVDEGILEGHEVDKIIIP
jgi:hypothetical protein